MGLVGKIKKSVKRPDKTFTGAVGPTSKSGFESQFSDIDTMYGLAPSGIGALEDYFGVSAAEAEKQAAKRREQLFKESLGEQRRQFDTTYEQQRPFYEAGAEMLPTLERGATAAGYGSALDDLLANSQISNIRGERIGRESTVNRNLSGLGDLTAREATAIDNLLTQRQQSLAGRGLTAGTTTAGYGQQSANQISNLLGDIGASRAQGIIGQQAARTQGSQNAVNLIAGLSDYFRN